MDKKHNMLNIEQKKVKESEKNEMVTEGNNSNLTDSNTYLNIEPTSTNKTTFELESYEAAPKRSGPINNLDTTTITKQPKSINTNEIIGNEQSPKATEQDSGMDKISYMATDLNSADSGTVIEMEDIGEYDQMLNNVVSEQPASIQNEPKKPKPSQQVGNYSGGFGQSTVYESRNTNNNDSCCDVILDICCDPVTVITNSPDNVPNTLCCGPRPSCTVGNWTCYEVTCFEVCVEATPNICGAVGSCFTECFSTIFSGLGSACEEAVGSGLGRYL